MMRILTRLAFFCITKVLPVVCILRVLSFVCIMGLPVIETIHFGMNSRIVRSSELENGDCTIEVYNVTNQSVCLQFRNLSIDACTGLVRVKTNFETIQCSIPSNSCNIRPLKIPDCCEIEVHIYIYTEESKVCVTLNFTEESNTSYSSLNVTIVYQRLKFYRSYNFYKDNEAVTTSTPVITTSLEHVEAEKNITDTNINIATIVGITVGSIFGVLFIIHVIATIILIIRHKFYKKQTATQEGTSSKDSESQDNSNIRHPEATDGLSGPVIPNRRFKQENHKKVALYFPTGVPAANGPSPVATNDSVIVLHAAGSGNAPQETIHLLQSNRNEYEVVIDIHGGSSNT